MKNIAPKIVSEKLSLYIDGMLDDGEARQLEEYIALHADAARELSQLRSIQKGIRAAKRVPENPWFWLQLSGTLEERRVRNTDSWMNPWRVGAGLITAATMAVVAVMFFTQGNSLKTFVKEQQEQVAQVYESGLMKGAIMPLLSSIDKEHVLQFALFGKLDLDSASTLQVAKGKAGGYTMELGHTTTKKKITLNQFYAAIGATPVQHEVVDSILNYGKAKIRNAVLVGEQDEIAIHADIAQLNRMMVSTIAASLEPVQRMRFQKLLTENHAPYIVDKGDGPSAPPEKIFKRIAALPRSNMYVVITDDSVGFADMPSDVDRFIVHTSHVQPIAAPKFRSMMHLMTGKGMRVEQKIFAERNPRGVFGNDQVLTIQFEEITGSVSADFNDEPGSSRPPTFERAKTGKQKFMPDDWRILNRDQTIDLDAVIGTQEERIEEQRQQQKQQLMKLEKQKLEQQKRQQRKLDVEL